MADLGVIERVDLREVWPDEAQDFTPWLAENLDKLGEALGLDLEFQGREVSVGPFFLDILAHDVGNDRRVVIENQLDKTDYDHLGKLLTYAAGYDAGVVVWLTGDFRDEHRAALDWLNQRTEESLEFYGVEIGAVKIGNSAPAPLFRLGHRRPPRGAPARGRPRPGRPRGRARRGQQRRRGRCRHPVPRRT